MGFVNTVQDSDGNSTIGTAAERGQASLGDRDSKRVVCDYQYPRHVGITSASEAKKDQKQGQ
jgi:hypothetical protein